MSQHEKHRVISPSTIFLEEMNRLEIFRELIKKKIN